MVFIYDVPEGKIKSGYVEEEPFNEALETLKQNNCRIITIQEYAKLRMQTGKGSYCSRHGARVSEDFGYEQFEDFFWFFPNSIINKLDAKNVTNTSRKGYDPFIPLDLWEEALKTAIKIPLEYEYLRIPTNELHNDEIFSRIYGDIAKEYGLFLKDAGIKKTGFYDLYGTLRSLNGQGGPITRRRVVKCWFRRLISRSGLEADCRNYWQEWRIRGIKID